MSLNVTTHVPAGDAVVITVAGHGDEDLLALVGEGLHAPAVDRNRLVVDVSDLTLATVSGVRGFLARLLEGSTAHRVAVVAARLSSRRILRRWGGDDLAIFPDVATALAAGGSHAPRVVAAGLDS